MYGVGSWVRVWGESGKKVMSGGRGRVCCFLVYFVLCMFIIGRINIENGVIKNVWGEDNLYDL